MHNFVREESIVRKIWGQTDTVLFIFAGASAEFALNKAVDWLYFTGKLPADPLGRLLSTVAYAKKIVFTSTEEANKSIDVLRQIHATVEGNRGSTIPDWAYRDVLFMLIHYSIASFELLERRLASEEKQEVFDVFYRVGSRMGLKNLPTSYPEWLRARDAHMEEDLVKSKYTHDLFHQYRAHLGWLRFLGLIEAQKLLVPPRVRFLLSFKKFSVLTLILPLYKFLRQMKLDKLVRQLLLPAGYEKQLAQSS
jgi:hypothetical protein